MDGRFYFPNRYYRMVVKESTLLRMSRERRAKEVRTTLCLPLSCMLCIWFYNISDTGVRHSLFLHVRRERRAKDVAKDVVFYTSDAKDVVFVF